MTSTELLLWARGTGFNIALVVFVAGMVLRFVEVLALGRKDDLSEQRGSRAKGGLRMIFSRSVPRPEIFRHEPIRIVNGAVMHVGLLAVILLFVPHIELFRSLLGFGWPGLPSGLVDALAAITVLSMLVALAYRMNNKVLRFLSTRGDYIAWLVTFLPVVTGYLAFNHLLFPYTTMLALHMLSAELLLVVAPFSKLTHMFMFALARWYQGAAAGYRGVAS